MKQSGAFFGIFAASWILWCELTSRERQWRRLVMRLAWLALGGLLPLIVTCVIVILAGDARHLWFWSFQYAACHAAIFPIADNYQQAIETVIAQFMASPCLW